MKKPINETASKLNDLAHILMLMLKKKKCSNIGRKKKHVI